MMYVNIEHASNNEPAYQAYGHDFGDFQSAVDYLVQWGDVNNEAEFAGTIYVFDDETLETEPDNRYQPTQWEYPAGLYVVEHDGTVNKI